MEHDITDTIAKLVRKADSSFGHELEQQDETLRSLKCINSFYGDWLDMGADLLFSIFKLDDAAFARQLPELAHLSKSARRQFLNRLESHLRDCDHCALRHEYEQSLNASIETVCRDNRELLVQQLKAELGESDSENDDDTESYLPASTPSIAISGVRQYRQHDRRGGH